MTITAYQVDNIIKAYNKQIRLNEIPSVSQGGRSKKLAIDMVSPLKTFDKEDTDQKIFSSLLDAILKDRL